MSNPLAAGFGRILGAGGVLVAGYGANATQLGNYPFYYFLKTFTEYKRALLPHQCWELVNGGSVASSGSNPCHPFPAAYFANEVASPAMINLVIILLGGLLIYLGFKDYVDGFLGVVLRQLGLRPDS